jgi:hypothetical protein
MRSSAGVRRFSSVLVLVTVAAIVSGCADRSTGTMLPRVENGSVTPATARVGGITLRNLLIEPPRGGESYGVGEDARMGLEVVNEGRDGDVLLSVQTPIASRVELFTDPNPDDEQHGTTSVPGLFVLPATPAGPRVVRAYVELRDLTTPARDGQSYPFTFRFASAGTVQTMVSVKIPKSP